MDFEYNPEKDKLLKSTRGISFEEIIDAINNGDLVTDIKHFNKVKYPDQRILVVKIKGYIYAVPYVWKVKRKIKFFKTIYANRKMKEKYLK